MLELNNALSFQKMTENTMLQSKIRNLLIGKLYLLVT